MSCSRVAVLCGVVTEFPPPLLTIAEEESPYKLHLEMEPTPALCYCRGKGGWPTSKNALLGASPNNSLLRKEEGGYPRKKCVIKKLSPLIKLSLLCLKIYFRCYAPIFFRLARIF